MAVARPPGFSVLGIAPRLFCFVLVRRLAAFPNSNRSGPPGAPMCERLVVLLTFSAGNAKYRSPAIRSRHDPIRVYERKVMDNVTLSAR